MCSEIVNSACFVFVLQFTVVSGLGVQKRSWLQLGRSLAPVGPISGSSWADLWLRNRAMTICAAPESVSSDPSCSQVWDTKYYTSTMYSWYMFCRKPYIFLICSAHLPLLSLVTTEQLITAITQKTERDATIGFL
jgi:hypothetical protein